MNQDNEHKKEREPMIWVFIGEQTGMPRDVVKQDFEPTIYPCAGKWIAMFPDSLRETLIEMIENRNNWVDNFEVKLAEHTHLVEEKQKRVENLENVLREIEIYLNDEQHHNALALIDKALAASSKGKDENA